VTAETSTSARGLPSTAALLGVLGVVYGDIGTSPLYALKASLTHLGAGASDRLEILGVLSLIFWSLIVVVTLKYVTFVMRADNRGEGGILALTTLAQRVCREPRTRQVLGMVGIIGACLFFGDGVITPAISVLSAVEGLEVSAPGLGHYVIPIAVAVIVVLFMVQWRGTGTVGRVFGPVMAVWFIVLGILGLVEIIRHPSILTALSPTYALYFCWHHGVVAFVVLGSVVLAVTGTEALYADMGHFGRRPIQLAWNFYVLPCLVLNYFGQGALIISDPKALENPFYLLCPESARIGLVILATAATVIASQAMISGAYSMARACMQLGILPRLTVHHTSSSEEGQIYLPQVNALLAVGVLILVLVFKDSEHLASAYGIAVTGTFFCTSILAMVVFRRQFGWSRPLAFGVFGALSALDLAFFSSNLLKVVEGGWVPLVFGIALTVMMTSWQRGRALLFARWQQDSMPLGPFLARLPASRSVIRVPGMAVFLSGNPEFVPGALLHNLKHNKVLHEKVLFVNVRNEDVPEIAADQRAGESELSPGIHRLILRYGFIKSPNIHRPLEELDAHGIKYDPLQASYFLGRELLVAAAAPKMPVWRLWLFLVMARNSVPVTEFFRIPPDRVVELGVRVAI